MVPLVRVIGVAICKTREISNFWKNGKIVILVKNPKFVL